MAQKTSSQNSPRWQEITTLWTDNRWLLIVAGWLLGMVTLPLLERVTGDLSTLMNDLVPETVGILFTVLILNRLATNRQQHNEKEDLIREMGSYSTPIALRAVEALRARGWLEDGSLIGRNFKEAELERANLQRAVLNRTSFVGANLRDTKTYHVQMKNVQMCDSDLRFGRFNVSDFSSSTMCSMDARGARFRACNFESAYLHESDFESCDFDGSNMKGTNLSNTNLEGAIFENVTFDEKTLMPDGRWWTPETDISRFTDPYHPDFWRPTDDSWLYLEYDDSEPPWWLRGKNRIMD
jgi:hypothetical protein